MQNSPIQKISYENYNFLIKRDDLLDSKFSGNKARKFYHYLINDFPKIKHIISHGSSQSNAMYSLSILAKNKNWNFTYYVNHIASFLKNAPAGNYKYALENNMNIIEQKDFDINDTSLEQEDTLIIKEGGALKEASFGIIKLADEINDYILEHKLKNIQIFLPSGTGTTALYLQKNSNVQVFTCACVGNSSYLKEQFLQLETDESFHPIILETKKKYHFGKLYEENYTSYNKLLKQTHIEFDLLYDCVGMNTLLFHQDKIDINNILYIHQGGIIGNETMIPRYERKYNKQ
jgi:1-aminocyclopropane-1-carboxylate deaminase/D-cysteine desulfhydrase-like pyridoxal-dependent ACC family enzyme